MTLAAPEIIKRGILHEQEEVRLTAVDYFARSVCDDTSIMPLVIEAVEQYGRDSAFRILRDADSLPQSPATIDWLLNELRKDYDPADVGQENHHWAIALLLLHADPKFFYQCHGEVKAHLPALLVEPFDERLRLHLSDWDHCWEAFLQLGRETMLEDAFAMEDRRRCERIIEALVAHGCPDDGFVLNLLRHHYPRELRPVMEWMEPSIVRLAGRMRLEKAIPMLIDRLDHEYDAVTDEVGGALARIGTEDVIQAAARAWWRADVMARFSLCEPFEYIHCNLAAERCRTFFVKEDDLEVASCLAGCMLGHFDLASIGPVREFVQGDEDDLDNEQLDVRYKLVTTCTIMGQTFPEYHAWYQRALATDWGWQKHTQGRLSKGYQGIFENLDA